MRFLLNITFISHIIITAADTLYEDCPGFSTISLPRNETVIPLPCHHWPSIHQTANGLWLNPGMFTKMILTKESMDFLNKISFSKNLTTAGNEADQSQLSKTISGRSDIMDITWDMIFQCTLKRKSKYVLVFSANDSGINIKQYLKRIIDTTMEIKVVNCRHKGILNNLLSYTCVFVACDFKSTRNILKTAIAQHLVTESHSWIILSEDTTAMQDLLYAKSVEVIDDLVLINHATRVIVNVSCKTSNSSTTDVTPYSDIMGYATRFTKPCREAGIVEWTHPLANTKALETFARYMPPKTLAGCHVTVLIVEFPPLGTLNEETNTPHGIDYEFLAITHRALGATVKIKVMKLQRATELLLGDDPLQILFEPFDVVLPLFGTDDETLNMLVEYTMPFIETSFSFIISTIPKSFSGKNAFKVFLLPFTATVWWLVLIVCFATTVAWTLIRLCHTDGMQFKLWDVWQSSFDIISIMPGQGVWDILPGLSFKIILATISMFTLLNLNCYSAKIIAFLSDTRPTIPFTTVTGFLEREDYGFATEYEQRHVNKSELFQFAHQTKSRLFSGMHKKRFTTTKMGKDFSQLPDHIGKNAYVMVREVCEFLTITHSPRLAHTIKGILIASKKLPIRRGFPHNKLYFTILKRLHEAGIYNKIRSETMYKVENIHNRRHADATVTAIEIAALSVLFMGLLIAVIASLIALVIEMKLTLNINT